MYEFYSNVTRVWSGAGVPRVSFPKKPWEQSISRAYIKKHAECQISFRIYETCIFVLLVNEFYIIMKIEMASIVH